MKTIIGLLVATLLITGCTNPEHARQVLEVQGYTDIVITGWAPFCGSDDDTYETGFIAKSVTGATVSGCIGEGLFIKNATTRLY